ncbi:universal stress protein [Mangrovimonas sp. DI 80]|uniref:universal stress protein n=1 Tax=Mangrovimonas sp. DI 80 TaxID=1779330 RepID=UPI000978B294|nr:universal stress protein [Mangrovimonas sp. DI 80]OMP31205.1 universal stress protein UspA [Mangrovimonas sp. DI 80]
MKKIIVPVDFSEYSEYALEAAAAIAREHDSEILVMHMLEISEAVLNTGDIEQGEKAVFFLKIAEQKFETFLDKPYLEGLTVTPVVKHFKVFSELAEVAASHSVDLIVMGSKGASGFSEIFVGSNTEKVVRHSDVPVLVVKEKLANVEFNNAVFACDFSSKTYGVYKKAMSLFKAMKVTPHILYVNLPSDSFRNSDEIEEKITNFLNKTDGNLDQKENVAIVNDYTVEGGVFNYANKINADLIAVATHGRTGFLHFFEGSISEDIANHASLPVLTFKI